MTIRFYSIILFSALLAAGAAQTLNAQDIRAPKSPSLTQQIKNLLPAQQTKKDQIFACAKLGEMSPEKRQALEQSYEALKDKQDWLILVDPTHVLPADYSPQDMTTQLKSGWPKQAQLRREAMDNMNAMIAAAKKDNTTLVPISTYRTWKYQNGLYQRNLARNGGKPTGYVARAGESQHHLGTAVDFNTVSPKDENIPALVWLRKHAGEYGFSLSFPKGAEAEKESGYPYEAWHYRYITKEAVALQDGFFGGDQHKTLKFLHDCVFNTPNIAKK